MKKPAPLLNNLERKFFEDIYRYLKNFPGWRMDNVFTGETIEHDECVKFSRYFYTGPKDKTNRLIVATHEAGHAIVLVATHRFIDEAVIDVKDHPKGWLGWVTPMGHKDANDYKPIEQEQVIPCKPLVKMGILLNAGGFVGESLVGKKTGANHEKFLVYCRCRHLDDQDGVEPLTNGIHYVEWCRKIILNNENLFWRITDDLLESSELSETVKTLLHSRVKREPTELFF